MAFVAGSIISKLVLDKSKWSQSIGAVKKDQQTLGGYVTANSAKFKQMGMAMTAAGGAIMASFGLVIKQFVKAGDEVHKMALRTGFATETLSELRYAAEISGANLGSLEKGVKKMSKTIVDAGFGLTTYIRAFDNIGMSVKDLEGLNPEEQFLKIGYAIADVEDPTQRAAAAVDIFGRAGTQLLPMFAAGSEGLDDLRKKAHDLGIVFDQEAANKAARMADAMTTLQSSLRGLGMSVAENLVPALSKMVEGLADTIAKVGAWIKEHPKLTEIILKAVAGLGALLTVLGPLMMMLPGLVMAIGAVTAAFALSTAGILAVVVAATAAYSILNKLRKAKEELAEATERADAQEKRLSDKLREIADRAGITRKEFVELTRKYKGNTVALAMAIKKGKEGVELQKAMAEVGAENVEEWKKVEAAEKKAAETRLNKLIPSTKYLHETTKTYIDYLKELGIKTLKDKEDRSKYLGKTIDELKKAYDRGEMSLWDYQKAVEAAKKETQDLATVQVSTALPAARNMVTVLQQAQGEYDKAKEKSFQYKTSTIIDVNAIAENWSTKYQESITPTFASWGELMVEHWGYVSQFTGDVNNAFNDMTEGMLQSFTDWGTGTTGILEGVAGVIGDFVDSVLQSMARMLLQMAMETARTFILKQTQALASVIASVFKAIPFPFNIATAAVAVGAVYALFSKIKSFAEGGVVEEPTLAMIGERGPEAVVPLDRTRGTAKSTSPLVGGGQIIIKPAPIRLYLDGRVVATAVAKFTPELTKDGRMKIDTRGLIRG